LKKGEVKMFGTMKAVDEVKAGEVLAVVVGGAVKAELVDRVDRSSNGKVCYLYTLSVCVIGYSGESVMVFE
jgi:hypothetical protein